MGRAVEPPATTLTPPSSSPVSAGPVVTERSNGAAAEAAGFGTVPYPRPGSSMKVQGVDGYEPERLAAAICRSVLASTEEAGADADALHEAVVGVLSDLGKGRSGAVKVLVGSRLVSMTLTTEVRNVRRLGRGRGTAVGTDSGMGAVTGTDTVSASYTSNGATVGASHAEADTEGWGVGGTLSMDTEQELMRGAIHTEWTFTHEHAPRAMPGVNPLVGLIGGTIQANLAPMEFGVGGQTAGELTFLRLIDEG